MLLLVIIFLALDALAAVALYLALASTTEVLEDDVEDLSEEHRP